MTPKKIKRMPERMKGAVLPLVFVICLICGIIGIGLLTLSLNAKMLAVRSGTEIASRCAADAAVAAAIFQMNEKLKVKPWDGSSLPAASGVSLPSCDAKFSYTVSEDTGVYTVRGTGRAGFSVRSVEGTLRIYSVFDYALFARDTLELKNSAVIDWINSQVDDWPLQVGTNSTSEGAISFKSTATVNGDVVVGYGGDPDVVIDASSSVVITGSTYAMFSDAVLPSVSVPPWLDSMASGGDIDIKKGEELWDESGKYDSLTLGNDVNFVITEPVVLYIVGDITLGNSAKINIGGSVDTDNDASLIIYLGGNLEGKNTSEINNLTGDAGRFTLYGLDLCTKIVFKNGVAFYGALYAPNAFINLYNSNYMYGSIIGQSVILNNSVNFYYDASLRDRTVNDEAIRFVVHRWSE